MSREEAIQEMLQYFDKKAEVGIFWYHPLSEELFEVHSIPALSLQKGQLTFPKLHKDIWTKQKCRAKDKQKKGLFFDPIYLEDYTQVPRGRIFFKDNKFYVFIGSWITEKIKKLILKEFNLSKSNTEFKIDSHWDLGYGWSSENELLSFEV